MAGGDREIHWIELDAASHVMLVAAYARGVMNILQTHILKKLLAEMKMQFRLATGR
jgi:hypothetical protein